MERYVQPFVSCCLGSCLVGWLVGCCQSSDFQRTKPQPQHRPQRLLADVTKPLLCSNFWDPSNRFPSKKTLLFVVQVLSVTTQRPSVKTRSPSAQAQFPLQFRSGLHKSRPTEFRTLAPIIFSIINAVSPIHRKLSFHIHWAEVARWQWGSQVTAQLWVCRMELASCDHSVAQNLEVVGRLSGNSWNPGEGFRDIDQHCVSYTGMAKRSIGRASTRH